MKSSEKKQPKNKVDVLDLVDPDTEMIPPDDESDAVDALLHRIGHRDNHASARMSFRYADEEEYIDVQDLHRVMEDLQFGHDLRM